MNIDNSTTLTTKTSNPNLTFSIANILAIKTDRSFHFVDEFSENSTSDDEDSNDQRRCSTDEMIGRKKKTRTVFSRTQIFQLETTFDRKPYLSNEDRAKLAQVLCLTEQQIKIWFQNRRNKLKRQIVEATQTNFSKDVSSSFYTMATFVPPSTTTMFPTN